MDMLQAIRSEIARHLVAIHDHAALLRLSKPAIWGMSELRDHYPTWSEERIKRELKERLGIKFGRGHSVEVHADRVIDLDEQLAGESRVAAMAEDRVA